MHIHKKALSSVIKIFIIFSVLFLFQNHIDEFYQSIYDSYTTIGFFIATTLIVVYFFEFYTQNALIRFLAKYQKLQVPISALLGVLPGCGGAIIVVTNYSKGVLTFGSMVATLIATMGDAAILLMQKKPEMAFALFVVVSITGMVVGYTVDFLAKNKFAEPSLKKSNTIPAKNSFIPHWMSFLWIGILFVNALIYFVPLLNEMIPQLYIKILTYTGMMLTVILWLWKNPNHTCNEERCFACSDVFSKIVIETSFIISWILIGMLSYKIIFILTEFDVHKFIDTNLYYIPLVSAIIGLVPGCGPQIVVTTFYVNGMIPFAAQVSNAISNDGDALMPAIAMQPKKAIIATIYSFFPALIVGYTILFFYKF